ncbi:MAG: SDR family NAD(P)-dependent oxidoreductase [Alphaproteobacteria bacterium]
MGILDGKVAVVTGASNPGGIGETVAKLFAAQGAKVVVAARNLDALQSLASEIGGTAVACDIGKEDDIKALAKAAADAHGKIDIAVNCAGINVGGAIAELTTEQILPGVMIHYVGTTLFIRYMAEIMNDGGAIATASTLTAYHAGPGMAVYSGTKAAADQVVRVAAVEYGARGIKVNSFSPGFTRTPMTEPFFGAPGIDIEGAFARETAMGRIGTTDDIANGVLFLCSDQAFVSGQNIQLNGGASLGRLPKPHEMAAAAE